MMFRQLFTRRGPGLLCRATLDARPTGAAAAISALTEAELSELLSMVQLRATGILTREELSAATGRMLARQNLVPPRRSAL
jgi:hypothetical protein